MRKLYAKTVCVNELLDRLPTYVIAQDNFVYIVANRTHMCIFSIFFIMHFNLHHFLQYYQALLFGRRIMSQTHYSANIFDRIKGL